MKDNLSVLFGLLPPQEDLCSKQNVAKELYLKMLRNKVESQSYNIKVTSTISILLSYAGEKLFDFSNFMQFKKVAKAKLKFS